MSKVACRGVIMGQQAGSDSTYRFEIERDFERTPADELVEHLMAHLQQVGMLRDRYDYELNSAIRNRDAGVVMAIGSLHLRNQHLPFAVLITPEG